jgi:hypothetical protein
MCPKSVVGHANFAGRSCMRDAYSVPGDGFSFAKIKPDLVHITSSTKPTLHTVLGDVRSLRGSAFRGHTVSGRYEDLRPRYSRSECSSYAESCFGNL